MVGSLFAAVSKCADFCSRPHLVWENGASAPHFLSSLARNGRLCTSKTQEPSGGTKGPSQKKIWKQKSTGYWRSPSLSLCSQVSERLLPLRILGDLLQCYVPQKGEVPGAVQHGDLRPDRSRSEGWSWMVGWREKCSAYAPPPPPKKKNLTQFLK